MRKTKANKAKTATAVSELHVPKNRVNGGGSDRGAPKKDSTAKYCKWCKAANRPFTTHDNLECRRFEKRTAAPRTGWLSPSTP